MKSLARCYVWWPAIDREQEEMVQKCDTCQLQKSPPAAPLHPWKWPENQWNHIHIDYAGPFLGKMFLIAVDATSKWIETHIMNTTTSTATFCKEMRMLQGIPRVSSLEHTRNEKITWL